MKFKTDIISPLNSSNSSIKKKMKGNRKSNTKFSPEENLGLKLEKLIEKGVKVKKIDSPDKPQKSPKPSVEQQTKRVTPSKVMVAGAGGNLKSPGSGNFAVNIVQTKPSPGKKNVGTEFANGNSKTKKEKKSNVSTPVPANRLDLSKVIPAVKACLENAKAKDRKNKLIDTPEPLYMVVTVVKKGTTANHMCRFNLPHRLVSEDADVCMIVRDEKGQSTEKTIEDYEELLRKNDVKQIKKIVTYRQLREEYAQHELRRKLCNAYDFFVGDGRLSKSLLMHLGKHFIVARKIPIYVKIDKKFKDQIDKAFHKTAMKITANQDSFSCIIGNRSFSAKDIAENIECVANNIKPDIFPGGWENVRSISIKTQNTASFPIYYSCVNPNNVVQPVMTPKRPKAAVPVLGELSTFNDSIVRVEPGGDVKIVKKNKQNVKKNEDDSDDNDYEDEDEDNESEEEEDTSDFDISDDEPSAIISPSVQSKAKKNNLQNDPEADESDDDSDENDEESEDDIGDKAEQEYLQEMRGQLSDDDNDVEDDGDSDEDDDDEEEEESNMEDDEDDSNDSESDDSSVPPNEKKRKLSLENNKAFTPSKKNKPDNVVDQNKSNVNIKGKGMFDTSLGETWDIKKKQAAQKLNNQKGGNKNKNVNKNRKLSKSQRKANIKTKGKKNNRR